MQALELERIGAFLKPGGGAVEPTNQPPPEIRVGGILGKYFAGLSPSFKEGVRQTAMRLKSCVPRATNGLGIYIFMSAGCSIRVRGESCHVDFCFQLFFVLFCFVPPWFASSIGISQTVNESATVPFALL